ncbi:hypothetical protein GGI10_003720, partial [Coemansia sp. RSA 2530]
MFIRKTIHVAAKASRSALNRSLRKRNADAAFPSVVADANAITTPVVTDANTVSTPSTDATIDAAFAPVAADADVIATPVAADADRAGHRLMCAAYALESMDTSKLAWGFDALATAAAAVAAALSTIVDTTELSSAAAALSSVTADIMSRVAAPAVV